MVPILKYVYHLLLSMIDAGPKNEGRPSMVVAVHTLFRRIYTSDIIAYSRTQTGLRDTYRAGDTHLRAGECLVAIDSGFIGAVSRPDFGPSVYSPRGNRVKAAPKHKA